jgi:hypothetical protein
VMKTEPVTNMRAVILCSVFLLATPLFARESTDVIVMKNGDHLTGQVKGLNAGVFYVSMKYILGTSSVQWSEVAHLESKQLFLVKTEDGSVYTGTLNTTNISAGRPCGDRSLRDFGTKSRDRAPPSRCNGRDLHEVLPAIQRKHQYRNYLLQRQPSNPVQLGDSDHIPAGTLGRSGQLQLHLVH